MNHYRHIAIAILQLILFVIFSSSADADVIDKLDYPRVEHSEQGSVTVDFPTINSWADFLFLEAWLPVEIRLKNDDKSRVGAVKVRALTDIDFDQRTVRISAPSLLETRFSDTDTSSEITELAAKAINVDGRTVPLDVLLRLLPEDFQVPGQPGGLPNLNFEPPSIVVSETPLKLLSIDKEPVRTRIEGTSLEFVVNTNWSVFYDPEVERWYVLNDGSWVTNNYLSDGGWVITEELPADFERLAANDEWAEVGKAFPAKQPATPPTPFIISLEMTELIQLDGSPRLSAIENTGIYYVRNTQSDLFKFEGRWYFLVSGRWFSNDDLSGAWQFVKILPNAFAKIPSGHKKSHVLYSVPGTRQAKLALIEAALPHRTEVSKGAGAKLEVTWAGEPRFETIETTTLERGLNTPFQVIRHNNYYYLCYQGAWYFSDSPMGPWKVALQVPGEIYRIPATDPAFNVTFVKLDETRQPEEDKVNYSYSSGYTGSFSTSVTVVHGTGWYYPSNVYWGAGHVPVYWRHRPTYGYNMAYNPVYSAYGGRYGFYQPWAYSTTVQINSPTVDFTHGYGSAWEGPLQTKPGDPSETAEKSLDEFLPAKKSDGTEKFVQTSQDKNGGNPSVSASSLYASSALSSNMFSGPDGEVYKSENDDWHQYNDGSWSTSERLKRGYQLKNQPVRQEQNKTEPWLPAHKKTLSRSELDRQELARLEGLDNYSKYRMQKESEKQ